MATSPTVTPSAEPTPSPEPTRVSPSPTPTTTEAVVVTAEPRVTAPTRTVTPTTSAPTTSAPPPDLPPDQLMSIRVERDLPIAAPGNLVRVDVTVTNTSDRTLYLGQDTSCGQAFGKLSAPGLSFSSGSDACGIGQGTFLLPGGSRSQPAFAYIADTVTPGSTLISATAAFSLSEQDDQAPLSQYDLRVQADVPLQLQDAATGTRTFRLLNDTDLLVFASCPCGPPTQIRGPGFPPGESDVVTSSVHGDFVLYRESGSPITCLDVSSVPQGSTDTVLTVSSATPCSG